MTAARSLSVTRGVALQCTRKLLKNPLKALPPVVLPLFVFAAFSGALSAVGDTPGFGYYDFTAFLFVFILYMAAMFVGVFTAFDIAIDYASGLGARFMIAAPQRMAIITGYVIVALGRGLVGIAVVWAIALATGMPVRGDAPEIAGIVVLALLLNVAATLYGAGIALRFQSTASSVLILIPVFMALFLTPAIVPRDRLGSWLGTLAGINPLTPPLEAGRGFLADDPVSVVLAFALAVGLVIVFWIWAMRGMRRAEQGPGATRRRGPRSRRRPGGRRREPGGRRRGPGRRRRPGASPSPLP
jgi:ABC-2 type transport system permease protein